MRRQQCHHPELLCNKMHRVLSLPSSCTAAVWEEINKTSSQTFRQFEVVICPIRIQTQISVAGRKKIMCVSWATITNYLFLSIKGGSLNISEKASDPTHLRLEVSTLGLYFNWCRRTSSAQEFSYTWDDSYLGNSMTGASIKENKWMTEL